MIMISKRAALGFSFFHMAALAWSGLATGQSPVQVFKNLIPGLKSDGLIALAGGAGYEKAMQGLRNGTGVGVMEELKGDTLINAMRSIANGAERTIGKITHFKPAGKMIAAPIRTLAKAQELIDTHLWDHVNTGLKMTTYLTTMEKMTRRELRRQHDEGITMTPAEWDARLNLISQRAAQFTNDAYGNQNWNQMAMNVQSHMGHRIAAALNKPSTRGYIRMLVFAPDWSLSNFRVITKAGTGALGKLGVKQLDDLATPEYVAYSIRSALLFAFIGEALQQSSGQGSIFDDSLKDALRPDLGDGKQMEISKQLAEVVRIGIYGPAHVLGHKLGTLPKSLAHTDSIGDYLGFWGESSIPIGMRQVAQNPELGLAGILGAPIYEKR